MELDNMTGARFGLLTVLSQTTKPNWTSHRGRWWVCRCDCGTERPYRGDSLRTGNSKSCGCLHKQMIGEMFTKHGHAKDFTVTDEYRIWNAMKQRCINPNCKGFKYYGGRGITVCSAWTNDFMTFLNDVGLRSSKKHSIDRIDNNGNYEPGNVRWATWSVQANNKRSKGAGSTL